MWTILLAAAAAAQPAVVRYEAWAKGTLPIALPVSEHAGVVGYVDRYEVRLEIACGPTSRRRLCSVEDLQVSAQGADAEVDLEIARVLQPFVEAMHTRDIELRARRLGTLRSIEVPMPDGPVDRTLTETHQTLSVLVRRALAPFDLAMPSVGEALWVQETDQSFVLGTECSLGTAAVAHRIDPDGVIHSEGHATLVDPAASSRGCRSALLGRATLDEQGSLTSRRVQVTGEYVIPMDRSVPFEQLARVQRLPEVREGALEADPS